MSDRWRDESDYRPVVQQAVSGKCEYLARMTDRSSSYRHKIADGSITLIADDIPLLWKLTGDKRLLLWIVGRKGENVDVTSLERLARTIRKAM